MNDLVVVGLAGFAASLVDGALGMGFGPTSSSILLSGGLSPAAVSTTVNVAKVATGLAGGAAHWKFGNVDRRLVVRLAVPGCLGAIVGVTVLANVDGDRIRPFLSVLLILVGLRILLRFARPAVSRSGDDVADGGPDVRGVSLAGAAGGVTNGMIGAWGPVVTPYLVHKNVPPRVAIGSVNTAEVAVAFASAGSLIAALGRGGVPLGTIVAMLIGGVLGAPVAAWVIRYLPPRRLGLAVAALLLVTSTRDLSGWAGLGAGRWIPYLVIVTATVFLAVRPAGPIATATAPAAPEVVAAAAD